MHKFFIIIACLAGVVGYGQGPDRNVDLEFQHLNDGLSQNRVTSIIQDHLGYLWVGTYAGLNRYDGTSFEIFENVRSDSTSLPDSYILCLYEDQHQNLWIGTASGLARFDPGLNRFERWEAPQEQDDPYFKVINSIVEDEQGRLLVGTTGGLLRIDNDEFEAVSSSFQHREMRSLMRAGGNVWVGTAGGLDILDSDDNVRPVADEMGQPIPFGQVTEIVQSGSNEYWVSTQGNGAFQLSAVDAAFRWRHFKHDPKDPSSLGNDRVQTLLVDSQNRVWLGTENGGLDLFDAELGSFIHFVSDVSKPTSLNSNSIWEITEDREGRLWIGTFNQGVEVWDPYFRKFQSIKTGLSHNVVSAMEEYEGELWVGTDGGGINLWDGEAFRYIRKGGPENLTSDAILAFHKDSYGAVWVGTWAGGLLRYEADSQTFTQWGADAEDPRRLSSPNIFGIDEDRAGNLWVAALDGGVNRWDRASNTFFNIASKDGAQLTSNVLISLLVDSQDVVWAGTESGLNRIEFRSEEDYTVRQFKKDAENLAALQSNIINQIYEDPMGVVWIATGAGLSRYHPDSETFATYDKLNGLPNAVIKGLIDDANGGLWISTNNGISHLTWSEDRPVFENYNPNDGLQGKEFSRGVMYKDAEGLIFMGGSNGYSYFDASSINTNPHVPTVVLTDFKLFNQSVGIGAPSSPLSRHVSSMDRVVLQRNQNVFSIDFTALNLTHADRNQYEYQLQGFEDQWNNAGSLRSATYTNLAAGNYLFKVRASNNDGVWNEEGAQLAITVRPNWWETWWFRGLLGLAILSSIVLVYRYRRSIMEAAQSDLEEQVKAATAELEHKSMEIERQRDNLEAAVLDTDFVIREAVESGNFSARVQVEGKEGEWKKLGTSINQLFDSVLMPLGRVKQVMTEMAQGNMTARYTDEAKGDILDLANNVNGAIASLALLLGKVSGEVEGMTQVSDSMSQRSEDMAATTSEISRSIEEINAGAANQLRMIDEAHNFLSGIVTSADAMNKQAFSINQTAAQGTDLSGEGSKLMDRLAESMHKVMNSSEKTSEATATLSNRSLEISSIVRIMKEIAAQTNLLALNAAIEAAQAGDAGRGFAVVAEEIRKLAEDSKKSANEIESLISSMQDDTSRTAMLIQEMGADIKEGEQTTQQAATSFQEISAYYQKTFESSTDILNTAQQQSSDIQTVVNLIQNLVTVSEQTAAGSEEVNASTELMLSAMESVREQSQAMLQALKDLEERIAQFQLDQEGDKDQLATSSAIAE
ncbi:MAG: two-component regulator propeller domain-containing protein [Bacteroidota bacterium]